MDGVTTAEVNLDEVEAQLLEEEVGILLVVLIESYTLAGSIASEHAATGVTPGIAVDTCLEAKAVDIIYQCSHARGEALHVKTQVTILATTIPIAVVDVDILVACFLQACWRMSCSLMFSANVFHDDQPMVGVRWAKAAVATTNSKRRKFLRILFFELRFVVCAVKLAIII